MLSISIALLLALQIHAGPGSNKKEDLDPNGYFKKREWKLDIDKSSKLILNSEYFGEPVNNPSVLTGYVQCAKGKKLEAITHVRFCGINSVKIIGKDLEILFADYDPSHKTGYCTGNRKQQFQIPSCS